MNILMYFKYLNNKYYSIVFLFGFFFFFPIGYIIEGHMKIWGILTSPEIKKYLAIFSKSKVS